MLTSYRIGAKDFVIIFIVTFCYQLILASSLTPLSIYEGTDSCVFKQMGLALLEGKTPYLDLFDHKGPVVYIINAIAQWLIPGKLGIFLFHVINISSVTFLWYKTSCLFLSKNQAIFPVLVALFSYLLVNYDGNLTEEWSLLPISYGLYLYAKFYRRNELISFREFFLLGIGMGVITLLRINNMIADCCMILVYSYLLFSQKKIKDLQRMIAALTLGYLSVIGLVFAIIYIMYGIVGVNEMIYGTFTFNFEYMKSPLAVASNWYRGYVLYGIATIVLMLMIIKSVGINRMSLFLLLCYICTFLVIGTKGWSNYFIIFAPIVLLTISVLYSYVGRIERSLVFLLFFIMIPYKVYNAFSSTILNYESRLFNSEIDTFIKSLPVAEKSQIWNFNTTFTGLSALQRNGLTQANRVILKFQLDVSDRLKESEIARFDSIQPQWVMTNKPIAQVETDGFEGEMIRNHYDMEKQIVYNGYSICFYKRKTNW